MPKKFSEIFFAAELLAKISLEKLNFLAYFLNCPNWEGYVYGIIDGTGLAFSY